MRIMITGGGTGGHTSPALAIVEELRKRDSRLAVQWIGRRGGLEERVCRNRAIPFRWVPVEGWPRGRSLRKLWAAAKLALGTAWAAAYLLRFRPRVVICVGGYVCLPLGLAAERLGIPTVLHEQNKRLGMANRLLAPRAARLFLSYPDTLGDYPKDRAEVVGNPVRADFVTPPAREAAREKLGLDPAIPVALVVGGSQGAHSLNEAVRGMLASLDAGELQLLWMTGAADAAAAREAAANARVPIQVFAFIDDMATACAAADLVVGRAGASSTAELAVLGKPAILVPYPHATDNHQEANARAFEQAGAAVILLDGKCSADSLLASLREILRDPERLAAMGRAALSLARPGAAAAIAERVLLLTFART